MPELGAGIGHSEFIEVGTPEIGEQDDCVGMLERGANRRLDRGNDVLYESSPPAGPFPNRSASSHAAYEGIKLEMQHQEVRVKLAQARCRIQQLLNRLVKRSDV
ncbi:MAG TPA: hypothetical protein VFY63_01880 [Pseudorhizobium sp.]|nr:hypothetical protein [Pseudorhizobium sp.]